jgi:hypothetical protein
VCKNVAWNPEYLLHSEEAAGAIPIVKPEFTVRKHQLVVQNIPCADSQKAEFIPGETLYECLCFRTIKERC